MRSSGKPGVDMVAPFGTSLHVSGRDGAALEAAVAPYRADPRLRWEARRADAGGRVHRPDEPGAGQFPMTAALDARRFLRDASLAMLMKEFVQLRRDRITFATMIMIPLMQLVLFGYAINTTPRNMPTAVLLQETSDVGRSILAALAEHQILQDDASGARRGRVRPAAAVRHGAVRGRDPGEFRARAAARRPAGAAGRGRRDRSGRDRLGALRARPARQHRAGARPCAARRRRAAVRDPHPCALQSGRHRASSTSCPACSARS